MHTRNRNKTNKVKTISTTYVLLLVDVDMGKITIIESYR